MNRFNILAMSVFLLLHYGCGQDDNSNQVPEPDMTLGEDGGHSADMTVFPEIEVEDGCDPIQPDVCAFPWPSSFYLSEDDATITGYRINFGATSLPASFVTSKHLDPGHFDRLDGFGLGSQMYTLVPNVDPSNLPNETAIAESMSDSSPVLLIEVGPDSVRRVACWTELDTGETDPAKKALFVNPAEILKPNHQYIVALRNLTTLDGNSVEPTPAFKALRDQETAGTALAGRQTHFDAIFAVLEGLGVERSTLDLAWDFHTASEDSLHGPMLSLWSKALAVTGEDGPPLVIDEIETFLAEDDGSGAASHPHIAYRIHAHIEAPQYVKQSEPAFDTVGWILNEDENGEVLQNGTTQVPILIGVPRSAVSGTPQTLLNFGHGNFNDRTEGLDLDSEGGCGVNDAIPCRTAHSRMYDTYGYTYFATDMIGMSEVDYDTTIPIMLIDLSLFPWLSDRLHQGMLNRLLATRTMHRQFATHPEILNLGITMADTDVRYWGISGGAILGGSFAALSPDVSRAALSVFGMNWVSVLWRSRQFLPLFVTLMTPYPNRLDQIVTFGSLQLLWDPTDSVSYMRNLVDSPIDGHPQTHVLVDVIEGDQSVPPILAENLARSNIGIRMMENFDDERTIDLVEDLQPYPYTGSGITGWHTTAEWSREGNQPPTMEYEDTHGHARQFLSLHRQIANFFSTGEIIDVCGGGTCPTAEELAPFLEE